MPSWLVACWAKMSRISATRSTTSTSNSFSRLRCCAGVSSSSKITTSTSSASRELAQLLGLALADVGRGVGRVAPLQLASRPARRPRCRRAARARRATPRPPRRRACRTPVPTSSARCRTTLEVDLGRGEPPALPVLVRAGRTHGQRLASAHESQRRRRTRARPARRGGRCRRASTRSVAAGHVDRARASPTRPRRCATAAAAHAPVPHDSVSPTPRSHTRIAMRSACRSTAHELDVGAAREALVVLEARAVLRDAARRRGRRRTARGAGCPCRPRRRGSATPWNVGRRGRTATRRVDAGSRAGSNVTGPMSTSARDDVAVGVALERRPCAGRRRCRRRAASPSPSPARAATHARQRMPLPLISATPAVGVDAASSCSRRRRCPGSIAMSPSAPMPRCRSQSADDGAPRRARGASPSSASRTRKSLPVAWSLASRCIEVAVTDDQPLPGARASERRPDSSRCPNQRDAGVAPEPHALAAGELPGAAHGRRRARRRASGSSPSRYGERPPVADRLRARCATAAGLRRASAADLVDAGRRRASPRPAASIRSREHRRAAARRRPCATGNTVGPYSSTPGAERRERPAGELDHLERADDAARGCRARCAPPRPGRAASQLGVRGARARRRVGVAASSSARTRAVLGRERRGRRRPPARTGRCRRRAARAGRALRCRRPRRAPPPGTARPTSPRTGRRRRSGGAAPRRARPASAWRCRCPCPRYTCIESSETISTSPSAPRDLERERRLARRGRADEREVAASRRRRPRPGCGRAAARRRGRGATQLAAQPVRRGVR